MYDEEQAGGKLLVDSISNSVVGLGGEERSVGNGVKHSPPDTAGLNGPRCELD